MGRQGAHDTLVQLRREPARDELLTMLDGAIHAARARPGSAVRHCNVAILLTWLDRGEEAIIASGEALKAAPRSADALVVNGISLYSLGRWKEALQSFERAIEIDPRRDDARNNRGDALARLGRHEEAVRELDRAITMAPGDPAAHVNRGRALRRLGRCEKGIESLRKAMSLGYSSSEVWLDLAGMLFQAGRLPESLGAADEAIRMKPGETRIHHMRGTILHCLGRRDDARSAFERAHMLDPAFAATTCPVDVDDVYVAWHEAKDIRDRIEAPTSPKDVMLLQIRSRVAEFLNASKRVLEYHKRQHNSSIMDDFFGLETKAREYLQCVNKAKHERLPDVRVERTGKRKRVYPHKLTGHPMAMIEEGARLVHGGRHYGIDALPDGIFGGDVGKGFTHEERVYHILLEDGEVELVEFMDTILAGVKSLLHRHGYDTAALADASPYYRES